MCFGSSKTPDYSEQDRAREEERQGKIREGTTAVNTAFSRFTPDYFKGIGDSFKAYYQPQVQEQGAAARRGVALKFSGNPNSSAANRNAGNLEKDYQRTLQDVESGALDAEGSAKSEVEQRRGNLLNLVEAGSSTTNAANQANTQASLNIGRPAFSPIGDLFTKYLGTLGTAASTSDRGGSVSPFYQKQIDFLRGGSSTSGSQRVIGG